MVRPLLLDRLDRTLTGSTTDYCLAHLLRGIILRFIAHPESHTKPRPAKSPIPVKEADEQAMISFKCVPLSLPSCPRTDTPSYSNILKHGRDIVHDHHLVWFARSSPSSPTFSVPV